ncbi:hypothetical protein AAFF_G00361140 [Aldrovandia affinis]|uniref:SGNH hydrolase-type esterase domain-containing protein n=1 Tax=Aldrovandia affinis TaxID=143900 RepID=A0AAD7R5K2_9TELE|nr:hypothetical protein AAFF_G00361140 [Aldrovandia affinis]
MAELRRENQKTTSELKETQKRLRQLTQTIRELEEENSTLRAQTLKLKEDTANRDLSFSRELQQMKEQLQEKSCHVFPSSYTHATVPTPTLSPAAKPSTPPDPGNSPIPQPSPTSPTLTPRDSPPDTHSLPAAQPLNTEPNPDRPAKPEAQVVLLMDSNGKYLDTKRLFPGLITRAKRCRNTGQAMELLRQDTLGNPQYIVVHTGTNDLHTLHRETAEAMTKMAKRASREFPNSRVVISPLLPRTDTPPHVIHEINMEISRSCAALPNIHLAHHTNIGTWDLHDRLHLNKAGVRTFAKTLKDVTLDRNPNSLAHTTAPLRNYRPPRYQQERQRNTASHLPAAPRPPAALRPDPIPYPPTPPSHRRPPHHHQWMTYASVMNNPTPLLPTTPMSELGAIKEMLQTLCRGLLQT